VCPTEITSFSDHVDKFHALNCEVIGVSVDSKFSHLAWINTPRAQGGLGETRFPLVADLTKAIARKYNVLLEEDGIALRYKHTHTHTHARERERCMHRVLRLPYTHIDTHCAHARD
jgi:alkyl hydroperoxide reductase subunit AhpC